MMYRIADAHCDTLSARALSLLPEEKCMVTAEKLAKGGVGLQTYALFAGGKGICGAPYVRGRIMLGALDQAGVPFYLSELPEEFPDTPHGIISIEGGEMLEGSLERYDEFDRLARPRMIALTWNHENEIGCPAAGGSKAGLKPFGRALVREMARRGCLADVSHLNEGGFWELIETAELPPIASHSNCRALCGHPRNLTDEQIRALIDRGGFIGINFYARFVREEGPVTTEDLFRHIDHIAQMGGIHVLGFGSDFDGIDEWPEDLASPLDFPRLMDLLARRGYREADLQAIAHGNLYRLLLAAQSRRTC